MAGLRAALRVLSVLLVCLFLGQMRDTHLRAPQSELDAAQEPAQVAAPLQITVRHEGAPQSGVTVQAIRVGSEGSRIEQEQITDERGELQLRELPRGAYWLVATPPLASGWSRSSTSLLLDDEPLAAELSLSSARELRVQVHDEFGEPFVDARLEARAADPLPRATTTSAAGYGVLTQLSGQRARLRVQAPGYEAIEIAAAELVPFDAPEGVGVLKVVLKKLARLRVQVRDEAGAAVAQAQVWLSSPALWPARLARTDAKGEALLVGLPFASYTLRASKGALLTAQDAVVTLAEGAERSLTLTLVQGRMLAVRVVEGEREQPVADAVVTLAEGGLSAFPQQARTDRDGLAHVGPYRGRASVAVLAEGLVGESGVQVSDPPPETLVVHLERGATLEGEVFDARGRPVEGASVRVVGTGRRGQPIDDDPMVMAFQWSHAKYTQDRPMIGAANVQAGGELGVMPGPVPPIPRGAVSFAGADAADAPAGGSPRAEPWISLRNGRFTATPVTPGRVFAWVTHPEYLPGQSEWVQLAPDGRGKVRVVLQRGGAVEGVVLDARGAPASGVLIQASAGREIRRVVSAADGTFALASVGSPLVLLASLPDAPEEIVARAELELDDGETAKVTLQLDRAREPLPVRVVDERGRGVAFAQVSAVSTSSEVQRKITAFTDGDGEAELSGLRGLPLSVEITAPQFVSVRKQVDAHHQGVLRIELSPAERVHGEVRSARGERLAGARVSVETAHGVESTTTDGDGEYQLGGLGAGPLTVRVRAEGHAEGRLHVTVPQERGRRATELPRVVLEREGTARGVVVDEDGKPVLGARVAAGSVPRVLASGSLPPGVVLTDREGRFLLSELAAGSSRLEAYASGVGFGYVQGVQVRAGGEVRDVKIVLESNGPSAQQLPGVHSVAITLGEAQGEVVVVQVAEGSEAMRAGLREGDVLERVQNAAVSSIEAARARLDGAASEDVLLLVRRDDDSRSIVRVRREPIAR